MKTTHESIRQRALEGSRAAVLHLCAMALVCSCVPGDVFVCDSDQQCVLGGQTGSCEANGSCSFADSTCESGRRYGSLSEDSVRNTCVIAPDDDVDPSDPPPGGTPLAAGSCDPFPDATAPIVRVTPDQAEELPAMVAGAAAGTTFLLDEGTYELTGVVIVSSPDVALRGAPEDASRVILQSSALPELVRIEGARAVVTDMTLANPAGRGIAVAGSERGDTVGARLHRLRFVDVGEEAIAIESYADRMLRETGTTPSTDAYADAGVVSCSTFALTAATQGSGTCPDARAIRATRARDWTLRDNRFEDYYCDDDYPIAVEVTASSRDTIVERNVFADCTIAVRIGGDPAAASRSYDDLPNTCLGSEQHIGGTIRNNSILATDLPTYFDSGIAVWSACHPVVIHNTVFSTVDTYSTIEWRFSDTEADLVNNLVSHPLRARDDAQVVADHLASNLETASADLFADASAGDLHLVASLPGMPLGAELSAVCSDDIDGQPRSADAPDVGSDQLASP